MGEFVAGGYRPRNEEVLRNHGFDFPAEMFLTAAVRQRLEAQKRAEEAAKSEAANRQASGGGLFGGRRKRR